MMLIRAEVYCHGWPEGNISHGHVDIKVQGDRGGSWDLPGYNRALDTVLSRLERGDSGCDDMRFVDFELLEERGDRFDSGSVYAVVAGGQGEALDLNPVGKVFTAD